MESLDGSEFYMTIIQQQTHEIVQIGMKHWRHAQELEQQLATLIIEKESLRKSRQQMVQDFKQIAQTLNVPHPSASLILKAIEKLTLASPSGLSLTKESAHDGI